jgi:hypothetical protein
LGVSTAALLLWLVASPSGVLAATGSQSDASAEYKTLLGTLERFAARAGPTIERTQNRLSAQFDACPVVKRAGAGSHLPSLASLHAFEQAASYTPLLGAMAELRHDLGQHRFTAKQPRAISRAIQAAIESFRPLAHATFNYCTLLTVWEARHWSPRFDQLRFLGIPSRLFAVATQRLDPLVGPQLTQRATDAGVSPKGARKLWVYVAFFDPRL